MEVSATVKADKGVIGKHLFAIAFHHQQHIGTVVAPLAVDTIEDDGIRFAVLDKKVFGVVQLDSVVVFFKLDDVGRVCALALLVELDGQLAANADVKMVDGAIIYDFVLVRRFELLGKICQTGCYIDVKII